MMLADGSMKPILEDAKKEEGQEKRQEKGKIKERKTR